MIHFPCNSCRYEISAPDDEVGKQMLCPSCYTRQRIPPPQTNDKIDEAQAADQIYGVSSDGSEETDKYKEMIPIYCRVCNTLMYAIPERIGEHIACPDCGTKTLVAGEENRSKEKGERRKK